MLFPEFPEPSEINTIWATDGHLNEVLFAWGYFRLAFRKPSSYLTVPGLLGVTNVYIGHGYPVFCIDTM